MKENGRTILIFLLLGFALLLIYLFPLFFLDNFVRPVALVFWLFWQVLLSIDQRIYWSLLIFLASLYAFLHLILGRAYIRPAPPPDSNLTQESIDYWRTFIRLSTRDRASVKILKQNLVEMLVTMYTSRQPETPHWEVSEALQERQIPLPEPIYNFLFPSQPLRGRLSFREVLQTTRLAPMKWVRWWKGRDTAGYYRSIDEVLTFLESSMEITHDEK
jgi:hypothetical protein